MADYNQDVQINQDIPIMTIRTDFQEHNWEQHGNQLMCGGGCSLVSNSNASQHGIRIKSGLMLTGERGNWALTMERGNVIDHESHTAAVRLAASKQRSMI